VVATAIEQAHQAAVQDALAFVEKHALFTRTGPQGLRQVNVRGLVATAFTHRDSRAGDPDLHTHVAVANKVQTLDGRWLSIDGRVLFKANVAASETYNTHSNITFVTAWGCGLLNGPAPTWRSGRSGRSSASTHD
jgi:conjugative relaxase-like TrwC/TraI family protein